MICRRTTLEETIPLRSRILRPGRPVEDAHYAADPTAVHFGAFDGETLISTVTAHPEAAFGEPLAWRIRGMATDEACQGRGAGGAVLQAILAWGRLEGVPLFWCNARERAIPFYKRHGFSVESELFDIAGIGPHKVMKRAP